MTDAERNKLNELARQRKESPWKIGAALYALHVQRRDEDYADACELLGIDLTEGNILRRVYEAFHGLLETTPELTTLPFSCFRMVRTLPTRDSRKILSAAARHEGSKTRFVQEHATVARGGTLEWDHKRLRDEFDKSRRRIEDNLNGHHETLKALVETWLEDLEA